MDHSFWKQLFFEESVAVLPPRRKPTAPTNLKTATSSRQATITWDAVSGATGYEVYYRTPLFNDDVLLDTVTTTTYTAKNLTNDTTYTFKIVALNEDVASDKSLSVTATPTGDVVVEPPPPVTEGDYYEVDELRIRLVDPNFNPNNLDTRTKNLWDAFMSSFTYTDTEVKGPTPFAPRDSYQWRNTGPSWNGAMNLFWRTGSADVLNKIAINLKWVLDNSLVREWERFPEDKLHLVRAVRSEGNANEADWPEGALMWPQDDTRSYRWWEIRDEPWVLRDIAARKRRINFYAENSYGNFPQEEGLQWWGADLPHFEDEQQHGQIAFMGMVIDINASRKRAGDADWGVIGKFVYDYMENDFYPKWANRPKGLPNADGYYAQWQSITHGWTAQSLMLIARYAHVKYRTGTLVPSYKEGYQKLLTRIWNTLKFTNLPASASTALPGGVPNAQNYELISWPHNIISPTGDGHSYVYLTHQTSMMTLWHFCKAEDSTGRWFSERYMKAIANMTGMVWRFGKTYSHPGRMSGIHVSQPTATTWRVRITGNVEVTLYNKGGSLVKETPTLATGGLFLGWDDTPNEYNIRAYNWVPKNTPLWGFKFDPLTAHTNSTYKTRVQFILFYLNLFLARPDLVSNFEDLVL